MTVEYDIDYPFDQFPHGEIQLNVPRRKFLSALMTEISVYNKMVDGRPTLKLSDLGNWSNEDLQCVAPTVISGSKVELKENYVCGTPKGGLPILLFPPSSPALTVFNLFDGVNTLVEIAGTLKDQTGWTEEKSFAYVRGVFLGLVAIQLCQPKW